jgi:hypothetical protein
MKNTRIGRNFFGIGMDDNTIIHGKSPNVIGPNIRNGGRK